MLTATFRKIQSISDGNFHGCYASNKAEKFKFRRLSQGIESCAHAQALKLRKEEKEIVKQLKLLETEKEKHEKEKREKEIYSRLLRSSMESENTEYSEPVLDSVASLRRSSDSIHSDIRSHSHLARSKNSRNPLRMSKSYRSNDFEEVVPFYMQHSYSCYHDNSYNDILKKQQKKSVEQIQPTDEEPSWKIPSKLSKFKNHRKSLTEEISEMSSLTRLKLNSLNSSNETEDQSEVSVTTEVENTPSQMIPNERRGSKSYETQPPAIVDIKPVRTGRRNSVLTPMERNELVRHQRTVRSNSMAPDFDKRTRQLFQQKHLQRRNTYHGPSNCYLKRIIKNKMARQLTLDDVLHDEFIDDWIEHYDDGRVYPAYKENVELTFDDFRALRKCKYLRLSSMNWESLKQATLESLGLI